MNFKGTSSYELLRKFPFQCFHSGLIDALTHPRKLKIFSFCLRQWSCWSYCMNSILVFYNVKNGLSFITSKSSSKISVMKTNTGVFVVFKATLELNCQFSRITEILWWSFWRNKWWSIFDVVKDSSLSSTFINNLMS